MPTSRQPAPASSGLDRRTLLKVGVWAAPALAVAVAAPARAASTPSTVNLRLLGPQFGETIPMFAPSLTQRYDTTNPVGTVIGNNGSTAYAGPIVLTLTVDRRLWDVSGFTYDTTRTGSGGSPAAFSGPSISGDRATYTASFSATVAAGADEFTGVLVRSQVTFLGGYPNDTLAPEDAGYTWALVQPNDDANLADNVWVVPADAPVSAAPFGGKMTADFEQVTSGSGSAYRPTSATLTSVGPNPIPAGDKIAFGFDPALATDVAPQNVTLNGEAAPDLLTVADNTISGGWRSVNLQLSSALASDDVVAFSLAYSGGSGATPLSSRRSQISYSPAASNSPDQRARNVDYVSQPGS